MTMTESDYSAADEQGSLPSKTQRKKAMHALQELGTALVALSENELAQIPLQGELATAIYQARKLRQREARRRQLQYIGRLMRSADSEGIKAAYQALMDKNHHHVQQHHLVERWRDRLLGDGNTALTAFLQQYPQGDSQQLRQLIRGALKEQRHDKPPAQARRLFRYLREIISEQS